MVTVGRSHEPESLWLATSGKVDASVPGDLPTQVLLGLLPLQFVESPRRVLVIGLASAITPGAVALSPRVEQLDVVEIEPATAEAAAFFEPWNHGVLSDPRLRLIANDGRNHVLLSAPGSYDLVISEPSSPWISGPAQLFTREFFELGRSRLAPGGVWTQWIPTYGMDPRDLHSLLSTFADVFPHVVVYWSIDHADLVVMGALTPLEPGTTTTTARLQLPSISAELRRIDIRSPADLLARYQFDRTGIEAMGPIPYNTDDNMRIEYGAPLHQHLNTTQDNDRFLSRFAQMPRSTQTADPLDLLDLAYVWAYSEDPRARSAFRLLADRLPADHSLIEQIRADADALSPTHP